MTIQATVHELVLIQCHCSRIPKILSFESLDGVAFFFGVLMLKFSIYPFYAPIVLNMKLYCSSMLNFLAFRKFDVGGFFGE